MTITVKLDNIHKIAQQLLSLLDGVKVVAFDGEMGSGKTTLIKAVCECLDCVDVVNSPTFSIINEYFTKDGKTVYHFDFYRLKNLREAVDLGVEEYFYSGNFCFIEWAQLVEPLLPENHIHIHIEKGERDDIRILKLCKTKK
jgi:tRNA threonylcarbamoyladenosine biosynthesis protein TsaE